MRGLLAITLLVAACGGPPNETGSPGYPTAEVRVHHASATEAPVIEWEHPGAILVEVRESSANRVVWQIGASVTPHGQRTISPPLTYGAPALPPGVHPPDGPDYHTTVPPEPLQPAARYTVTVRWPEGRMATVEFVASDTVPMD